ncbi:hypothetical protein DL768_007575 [Monosporascus sp. mg162]|nr:hypothetical protein DL768_007575 [Monosporascus sp. mg162]
MPAPPNPCWALSHTIQGSPQVPTASVLLNLLNLEGSKERIQCRIFLHVIVYILVKDEGVSYKCNFIDCKEHFRNPLLLIQHLLICPIFHRGGDYWCYKCNIHHTMQKPPTTEQFIHPLTSSGNEDFRMRSSGIQDHTHSLGMLPDSSSHDEGSQAAADVSVPRGKASQIKEEEWNKRKDKIHQLYITENLPLDSVMGRMKLEAGFEATYVRRSAKRNGAYIFQDKAVQIET